MMKDNVVLLHPEFSEAYEKAKHAVFLNTITPKAPLSEEDLQAYNEYVDRHPHEFGWG